MKWLTRARPKVDRFDGFLTPYQLTDPALQEMAVIDALYSWSRHVRDEVHDWDPQRARR